ncbi:MAG: glutamate racemase [Candidatus Andersenbacteria bacterium]
MRNRKIGFFDSGVGGLTVVEAVHRVLPAYDTIYLGDTARAPYGNRSHVQLVEFTWQACQWLFKQSCELVIVACNSASASALREIQQKRLPDYPGKRILGVIRPTVEELAQRGYKKILVLSTEATKKSQAYVHEFAKLNPTTQITSYACPRWAPMIEAGKAGSAELRTDVAHELHAAQKITPQVDAILLACTHYPYVKKEVEAVLPTVPVFEQGAVVAHALGKYLARHPEIERHLASTSKHNYYVTGNAQIAQKIAQDYFGFRLHLVHVSLG